MGFITASVIAAAAVGSAVAKRAASKKAADARLKALDQMQTIDVPALQELARSADRSKYEGTLALQKEVDPMAAKARSLGLEGIVSAADPNNPDNQRTAGVLDQLQTNANADDEQLSAIRTKLLADAKTALDRGASMSPEFQAELVRTGLEQAGTAGLGPENRAGASGQTLRRQVGAAGLALEEHRRQQATGNVNTAQGITANKSTILSHLAGAIQAFAQNKQQAAGTALTAGQSLLPNFGLNGADSVNLELQRIAQQNKKVTAAGEINAGKALSQGQMTGELIGAGSSFLGGIDYGHLFGTTGTDNIWTGTRAPKKP